MNAVELTKRAMETAGYTSTYQVAKELGLSHVAVGKWLRGESCPSFEVACELAVMAGLPPVSTAAAVRQHSIDGPKHRRILRHLAALAACGAGVYLFGRLGVHLPHVEMASLYIMRNQDLLVLAITATLATLQLLGKQQSARILEREELASGR